MKRIYSLLLSVLLSLSGLIKVTAQCSTANRNVLLNPGTWTATVSGGTGSAANIIDGSLLNTTYWQSSGANQYVQIDLQSSQPVSGVVYYPVSEITSPTPPAYIIEGYTIETSTDGNNWQQRSTGTIPAPTYPTPRGKAVPININFNDSNSARYIRMIVADSGKRIVELLPIVCGSASLPTLDDSNTWMLNSAGATPTSVKTRPGLDNNWEVAWVTGNPNDSPGNATGHTINSPYNYTTTGNLNFYPVMTINKIGGWNTPVNDSYYWIGATQNLSDIVEAAGGAWPPNGGAAANTYFYRYRFNITDPAFLGNPKIVLKLWSDNIVVRVYVNGTDQNITPGGEFGVGSKDVVLTSGFVNGANEIMIQTYSEGPQGGFLVQNVTPCTVENQDVLLNPGTWTATASANSADAPKIINGNIVDNDYWQSSAVNQYVQIDLGSNHDLVGLVYYPYIDNTVAGYTVQTSTNGSTWLTRISGAMPASTGAKAAPVSMNFLTSEPARYIRFTAANSGARIAELLPIVCGGGAAYPTIDCSNVWQLNSGVQTATTTKLDNYLESNWEVAWADGGTATIASPLNYTTTGAANFYPAMIEKFPVWVSPAAPNNYKWISASRDTSDIISTPLGHNNTYFYRYRFNISDPVFLNTIKLRMNFVVDNTVVRVYVNGIDQDIVPGGTHSPALTDGKSVILTNNFQLGYNEIMVQTYSQPGQQGLMVQNLTACSGADFGDAPETFGTAAGPAHNIETDYPAGTVQLLKMGANNIDSEASGTPSPKADSDDLTGTDDEDGVTLFPYINSKNIASYSVDVSNVTNNSGANAYIVAWIDWNQNGVFDTAEKAVSAIIPNGSNNLTVPVTWTNQTFASINGYTFARFRISSNVNFNTSATPISYAGDGEVEDYLLLTVCIKPGDPDPAINFTKIGISTKKNITVDGWPESVPNGYIALDAASKGMVITHMTTAQRDLLTPLDGMLIYNTDLDCVQLYRGTSPGVDPARTGWNCIERGCNE